MDKVEKKKKIYGEVQLKHSSSFSLIFRNAQPRIPPQFGVVIDIWESAIFSTKFVFLFITWFIAFTSTSQKEKPQSVNYPLWKWL